MNNIISIVLAAGEGKRMMSSRPKVMHNVCGKPMIERVVNTVEKAGIKETIIVVGHKADEIKQHIGQKANFVHQDEQLGTGHAVMQALPLLDGKEGFAYICCGDVPLVTEKTITGVLEYHKAGNYDVTVITAEVADAAGYGRIIRNSEEDLVKIVEHRDANEQELKIREINSGLYCFTIQRLIEALGKLTNDNSQKEYYLTDAVAMLAGRGYKAGAFRISSSDEIMGINDRIQLAKADEIARRRKNEGVMLSGVTILGDSTVFIDEDVIIEKDTVIYPDTIIEGSSRIGSGCTIGPGTRIKDSNIGEGSCVQNSVVTESIVGKEVNIGPFAYIRPECNIGNKVKIGDFVELKKSSIGDKTKIPHLAYVGDAEIGKNVNMACGTITVNYDGREKFRTKIGDNAFIGCNVSLVAPVEIKEGAYIAAGSTITEDVPENSLAIARSRQTIKENWVKEKGRQRG